jgi:nitronate monooxygenase
MTNIPTALAKLLGIKHPILLAPMGSVSGGVLAAAVSQAGGLGFIGSGYAESAAIIKEREVTSQASFGIGLFTWALDKNPACD